MKLIVFKDKTRSHDNCSLIKAYNNNIDSFTEIVSLIYKNKFSTYEIAKG